MTTRSLEDILTYEQAALESIRKYYPVEKRGELESLLVEQINDELKDYAHTRTDR